MRAESRSAFDWRDPAAYAPLLGADRSLFAWEWLRRDPGYAVAAEHSLSAGGRSEGPAAAAFGLVRFEPPDLAVPHARPLWRADVHLSVLAVERADCVAPQDAFTLDRLSRLATLGVTCRSEHLLLSDGLRAIRLDAPHGTFGGEALCLRYLLEGLAAAELPVLTLRRFLALCRNGRFASSLHPREPRARRWVMMLRAWDGLRAGAGQREIAQVLLSSSAGEGRWRSREPSLRSRAQRLVHSARAAASGGYRALLADPRRRQAWSPRSENA